MKLTATEARETQRRIARQSGTQYRDADDGFIEGVLDQVNVAFWLVVVVIIGALVIFTLPRDLYAVYECASASIATAESYTDCLLRLNSANMTLDSGASWNTETYLSSFATLRQFALTLVVLYLCVKVVLSTMNYTRSK